MDPDGPSKFSLAFRLLPGIIYCCQNVLCRNHGYTLANRFDVLPRITIRMPKLFLRSRKASSFYRLFPLILVLSLGQAQTDENIFREFQFDFSTPGARANAMGRAFVGLADEATAAYNNPAGLSVLARPEFSIEYRDFSTDFEALKPNEQFSITSIQPDAPEDSRIDLDRIGFASFSFSLERYNFSAFYANNLDYRRDPVFNQLSLVENNFNVSTNYIIENDLRHITLNTYGLSVSRDFGKLDLGIAVAVSSLSLDFTAKTSLSSRTLDFGDLVISETDSKSNKPAYVLGALYQVHPRFRLGFSYKRQPRFTYTDQVNNFEYPDGNPIPIHFKIPDSLQLGFALQPNDFWTILLDVDWVQYEQLLGSNMTLLSRINAGSFQTLDTEEQFFTFSKDDFRIGDNPDLRVGAEYLLPINGGNIVALRFGGFLDPDHKTRFVGEPDREQDRFLYDIQTFIFNTDDKKNNVGYTMGLGFVWQNKLNLDVALVRSDRFERLVASFLYRF